MSYVKAALHDAIRPRWREDVISWLLGSPRPGRTLNVLDVGAGTGIGSRTVATMGHSVTAVDPGADMLAVCASTLQTLPPQVAARVTMAQGRAEDLPAKPASIDAVLFLQSWQWANPVAALAECDRVLKTQGTVGMAWHTWDRRSGWVQALSSIVEPNGAPADQTRTVPRYFGERGSFERRDFPFTYELSVDQLLDLAASWAFVTQRADKDAVLEDLRALGERSVSVQTGRVSFPHITAAFRMQP